MANYDLTEYDGTGGAVQPYHPLSNPLPSSNPATVDQGFYDTPSAGVDQQQLDDFMHEIGGIFVGDMHRLGMDPSFTNLAFHWYEKNALSGVSESPHHHYSLKGLAIPKNELGQVHAYCNYMASIGASEQFVKNSVWWVYELAKRLTQSAPTSGTRSLDDLSDAEYAQLQRKYNDDAQKAEAILRREWGHSYESNLAVADRFLHDLPANHRQQIESDVIRGVSALNSPDVIRWLFQQAIGVTGNISNVQAEIDAIVKVMTEDRKRYNSDEALQLRLRYLYSLQQG